MHFFLGSEISQHHQKVICIEACTPNYHEKSEKYLKLTNCYNTSIVYLYAEAQFCNQADEGLCREGECGTNEIRCEADDPCPDGQICCCDD